MINQNVFTKYQIGKSLMGNEYRVKYKKGDLEIEIQSTDKNYVDTTLTRLLDKVPTPRTKEPESKGKSGTGATKPRMHAKRKGKVDGTNEGQSEIDVARIVNAVNDSEDHGNIETHVLNKRGQIGRVLLAFRFAHDCGFEELTTGDVEKITDQLGVKLHVSAVSHCISDNRKFFSTAVARKKGTIVPYKLNRQGQQAFAKILEGEKP